MRSPCSPSVAVWYLAAWQGTIAYMFVYLSIPLGAEPVPTWSYLLAITVVLAAFVLGQFVCSLLVHLAGRFEAAGRQRGVQIVLRSASAPARLLVLDLGLFWATELLRRYDAPLPGGWGWWLNAWWAILVLAAGWFLMRLVNVLDYWLLQRQNAQGGPGGSVLIRRFLQTAVVIFTLLFLAQNVFNWDIAALLAGLGIGGLAVALAAQQTLSNLFGSVMIFADRPFRIGDRVRIRAYCGNVLDVGFRSTRLRCPDGTIVSIPNAIMASEPVENLGRHAGMRRELVLAIKPRGADALEQAVAVARELLAEHSKQLRPDDTTGAFLGDLKAAAVGLTLRYHFEGPPAELEEFHRRLMLELYRRLEDRKIDLA